MFCEDVHTRTGSLKSENSTERMKLCLAVYFDTIVYFMI